MGDGMDNGVSREMTSREKAEARFFTAQKNTNPPKTEAQAKAVEDIQEAVTQLAVQIYDGVPRGVARSKALTDLNTVAMWAIRGIFDQGNSAIN